MDLNRRRSRPPCPPTPIARMTVARITAAAGFATAGAAAEASEAGVSPETHIELLKFGEGKMFVDTRAVSLGSRFI